MRHKLLIAGSRDIDEDEMGQHLAHELKASFFTSRDLDIISGMARGADTVAVRVAEYFGAGVIKMPADWDKHGRSAGYIRNDEMVNAANEVWVWWDGTSKGTKHTIDLTLAYRKPLRVYFVKT